MSLDIYNLRGERIRMLVSDIKSPGRYSVLWDGLDETGLAVSSGSYFCRLLVDDDSRTIKMAMLR